MTLAYNVFSTELATEKSKISLKKDATNFALLVVVLEAPRLPQEEMLQQLLTLRQPRLKKKKRKNPLLPLEACLVAQIHQTTMTAMRTVMEALKQLHAFRPVWSLMIVLDQETSIFNVF